MHGDKATKRNSFVKLRIPTFVLRETNKETCGGAKTNGREIEGYPVNTTERAVSSFLL